MQMAPWFRFGYREIKRKIQRAKQKLTDGARIETVGCFGQAMDREKRLGPMRDRRKKQE